jgi:integrase
MESKAKVLRNEPINMGSSSSQPKTWEELRRATHLRFWRGSKGEATAFINASQAVKFFGENGAVRNVTSEEVDAFVRKLEDEGNSNATINRKLAALSKMLKFAFEREWVTKVPALHRKKEYEGRIRFLSRDEEAKLVATMTHVGFAEYATLCTFLIDTGARVGEVLGLEWKDVGPLQVTFWDTKNGKARTVPVTKRVADLLTSLDRKGKGPFCHVLQTSFNKVWNRVKHVMGLGNDAQFVPHALRHTCASRLVQAGVPLVTVKEFLGHKSIQVTLRYAHLLPQNLMDAVNKLEVA